ncbi:hypothetical protein [Hymenobacter antarcticus]|uniref:Uncharacterized protein n=1 Tax=Hymenobacter antarcticus TaxID=486270 RepID=A0ABP7QFH7_9BACT
MAEPIATPQRSKPAEPATIVLAGATSDDVFPPWQGMQYLHNMFTGLPRLASLDNARYPEIQWTSVREMLATRK